jgi:hypothetical protein
MSFDIFQNLVTFAFKEFYQLSNLKVVFRAMNKVIVHRRQQTLIFDTKLKALNV